MIWIIGVFLIYNFRFSTGVSTSISCLVGPVSDLAVFFFGSPTTSIYTPWTDEEAEDYLTTSWGEGAITEFNLEYLYGPEPEVSGE